MNTIQLILTEGNIYLIIFIYLWITVILESSIQFSKHKFFFLVSSSILLTLFIGCRWETGTDWTPYKELFDYLQLDWSFLLNVYHFDIGYVFFNAIVRFFTDNYTIFLLINSGVTIYFLSTFIYKTSPYPNLSILFFYTNFMLSQFMGSNRRMMAIVFVLWSFYYMYKNIRNRSILNLGLAFSFHRSSIANFIVYFIPLKAFNVKKTLIILLTSCLIGLLQIPAKLVESCGIILSSFINNPIVEKMVFYSENNDDHLVYGTGSLIISTLLAIIKRSILLTFYIYILKKHQTDRLTEFFYNIYIIGFAGYLFFIGSFFQMLTTYLAFIEVALIGRIYSYTDGRTKILFCSIFTLYGIFQIINALNIYPELYIPYIPFWSSTNRIL